VRGIKSEKWTHTFTIPDYSDPNVYTPGNSNYTLSHFFPVEDWRNAGKVNTGQSNSTASIDITKRQQMD
jgi:hypothetical protein